MSDHITTFSSAYAEYFRIFSNLNLVNVLLYCPKPLNLDAKLYRFFPSGRSVSVASIFSLN